MLRRIFVGKLSAMCRWALISRVAEFASNQAYFLPNCGQKKLPLRHFFVFFGSKNYYRQLSLFGIPKPFLRFWSKKRTVANAAMTNKKQSLAVHAKGSLSFDNNRLCIHWKRITCDSFMTQCKNYCCICHLQNRVLKKTQQFSYKNKRIFQF